MTGEAAAAGAVFVVRCAATTDSDPALPGPTSSVVVGGRIDGVTLAPGDRVLLAQLTGAEAASNGVWVVGPAPGQAACPLRPQVYRINEAILRTARRREEGSLASGSPPTRPSVRNALGTTGPTAMSICLETASHQIIQVRGCLPGCSPAVRECRWPRGQAARRGLGWGRCGCVCGGGSEKIHEENPLVIINGSKLCSDGRQPARGARR